MKTMHKQALSFAASHFAVSFVISLVCLVYFYGAGPSDAYHPDPSWVRALVAVLWILQLPVAALETVALRHSRQGANVLLLCVLGFLWSLTLGYIVPSLIRFLRNRNPSNGGGSS